MHNGANLHHWIETYSAAGDFLYRRMVSEARGDLFVKATCLENSDQSLTLFLTEQSAMYMIMYIYFKEKENQQERDSNPQPTLR